MKNFVKVICLTWVLFLGCQTSQVFGDAPLTAHMQKIKLNFFLKNGVPNYTVSFQQKAVIKASSLGFILNDNENFNSGFELLSSSLDSTNEWWQPVWGETDTINNHYQQLIVHLLQSATNRKLDIIFRVFEDGFAFRYSFPEQKNINYFIVKQELTQFNLGEDYQSFWIPGDYDTNEYPYTHSLLSKVNNASLVKSSTAIAVRVAPDSFAVQTPLMLKSADGLYVNIHEAALIGYPAMQLHVDTHSFVLSSNLVPDAVGNMAYLKAPFNSPWRTVLITNNAPAILASKTILNLNDPSVLTNTSWIKPMKFVGVWWEMQTGKGTWSYANSANDVDSLHHLIPNGRHSANTANVKRYIDFAAANNIPGVLVEGWNEGWEDWFGNWKENVFDFVTPYPDFSVKGLHDYAASKGVELIMHNETSGSATNYERQMDTAFRFMQQNGYHAVKTGYVGKIIPRGEHHDGQWMVDHYIRVAQKAASYKIMIDVHEPMRPTGLQRTYPNWMASEAGRGNEYNAFSTGNPPSHETILPFTRLMGGPMDYTPGIFKLKNYSYDTTKQVHTTLSKQLALYVTLYSPLQMAADLPENYEKHKDAFQFIKDVPVNWSESKIIAAEPGEYVTIARREKGKSNWYLGSITNEQSRTVDIDLSFLSRGTDYVATIYQDGKDADWKKNPESYTITTVPVNHTKHLKLFLAPGGGTAVSIKAIDYSHKGSLTSNHTF